MTLMEGKETDRLLNVTTFNVRGLADQLKRKYVAVFMDRSNIDILLLQETGHREEQEGLLTSAFLRMGFASFWSCDPNKLGLGQGVGIIVRRNIIATSEKPLHKIP